MSVKVWGIEKKKMSDLNPAEYNPRTISETALNGLKGSIEAFGLVTHIVWNRRTGRIVSGHQRCRALKEQGVEEVDVVVVDLDEQDEIRLNITMNNPNVRGTFTKDVKQQLAQVNETLGAKFEEIGLKDMFDMISRMPLGKETSKTPSGESGGGDKGPGAPKDGLKCPKCRSVWNSHTGEVVFKGETVQ